MPLFALYFQRLRYNHPPGSILSKLVALKCKFLSPGTLRGISKASLLYKDIKTYWASFLSTYLFSPAACVRVHGVSCESNPLLPEYLVPTEWYTSPGSMTPAPGKILPIVSVERDAA